jgi:hypothetical protein
MLNPLAHLRHPGHFNEAAHALTAGMLSTTFLPPSMILTPLNCIGIVKLYVKSTSILLLSNDIDNSRDAMESNLFVALVSALTEATTANTQIRKAVRVHNF